MFCTKIEVRWYVPMVSLMTFRTQVHCKGIESPACEINSTKGDSLAGFMLTFAVIKPQ